jgi:hypothetical protein
LFDSNKSLAQNEKENEDMNMHLLQMQKSSLDDPVADRTISVIAANTADEGTNAHWLVQKNKGKSFAQKSSLDDPVADRTVTVIKPNTV